MLILNYNNAPKEVHTFIWAPKGMINVISTNDKVM